MLAHCRSTRLNTYTEMTSATAHPGRTSNLHIQRYGVHQHYVAASKEHVTRIQVIFMLLESAFYWLLCLRFSFKLVIFFLRVVQENKSGCFFLNTVYTQMKAYDITKLIAKLKSSDKMCSTEIKHITLLLLLVSWPHSAIYSTVTNTVLDLRA